MATVRQLKVGLDIAEKKFGPDYSIGGAGHDVIWLFPPNTKLTDEEKEDLKKAGWHYDESEGWKHYT